MANTISGRRAARECALLVLFSLDAGRHGEADSVLADFRNHLRDDDEVIDRLFGEEEEAPDEKLRAWVRKLLQSEEKHWVFAERIVRGVSSNQGVLDDLISRCSQNWKLTRMGRVDRNILRLAAYELAFEGDIPGKATLNEAIEIAKRYGTEDSGKFVNGILDRIAQELEQV